MSALDQASFAGGSGLGNTATDPGLILPGSTLTPDFRPLGTSPAATLGAPPPADPFLDPTETWAGAVRPASPARGNVPWYAGWTVGW